MFLGELLGFEIRLVLIMIFSMVTAWLTINIEAPKNIFILLVVWMVPLLLTASTLIRLHVIPGSWGQIFFNIGVLLILTAGIIISRKHELTRTFLILSFASYLMEYIGGLH